MDLVNLTCNDNFVGIPCVHTECPLDTTAVEIKLALVVVMGITVVLVAPYFTLCIRKILFSPPTEEPPCKAN